MNRDRLNFNIAERLQFVAHNENLTIEQLSKRLVCKKDPFVAVGIVGDRNKEVETGEILRYVLDNETKNEKTVLIAQVWATDIEGVKVNGYFEIACDYITAYDAEMIEKAYEIHREIIENEYPKQNNRYPE